MFPFDDVLMPFPDGIPTFMQKGADLWYACTMNGSMPLRNIETWILSHIDRIPKHCLIYTDISANVFEVVI